MERVMQVDGVAVLSSASALEASTLKATALKIEDHSPQIRRLK